MRSNRFIAPARSIDSRLGLWLHVAILVALSARAESSDAPVGLPSYRVVDQNTSAQANLGQSVFETQWAAAGSPSTTGRVGVGPLYNATSCTACHAEGGRGRGPVDDGPAPIGLVIQLESPPAGVEAESSGDPIYGRVFNTQALEGVQAEGTVMVNYTEVYGYYYPYGGRWGLRVPHYHLVGMSRGPLAPDTVIKPRLAPALFGVGLIEAVPGAAIGEGARTQSSGRNAGTLVWHLRQGRRLLGRFGWQGDAVSIRDQTTRAFAQEMGLTSSERPSDDCTSAERDCRAQPNGGSPEVSAELIDALVAFVRTLAVPQSPVHAERASLGAELFASIGCAACHQTRLPVQPTGLDAPAFIAPYTDLRLHDLGTAMADENASGAKVVSRWRTAPLWGLGYRVTREPHPTFLHDGRARSTEEAILWHSGEAAQARHRFENLGPHAREALLGWLATL